MYIYVYPGMLLYLASISPCNVDFVQNDALSGRAAITSTRRNLEVTESISMILSAIPDPSTILSSHLMAASSSLGKFSA